MLQERRHPCPLAVVEVPGCVNSRGRTAGGLAELEWEPSLLLSRIFLPRGAGSPPAAPPLPSSTRSRVCGGGAAAEGVPHQSGSPQSGVQQGRQQRPQPLLRMVSDIAALGTACKPRVVL